ncbi:sensor histidine kinase YesM [Gracilibacillus halotolerans]|uniref:histidine kinase n=1 Tax=Gracilibacillus halotolerans TaxID=74386 RepID=A0A841RS16_9BACI|nr:sensor histidine kinase [Gracilibacillus halotolerans]MBB6514126.1 sensor histidine kinase YesM [Gracilibacillus halotolerans]
MKKHLYHYFSGRTIQSKLTLIFAVIIILFNIVTISIYVSSTQLMQNYHDSFETLLRMNSISQTARDLSDHTKSYVLEQEETDLEDYYNSRLHLKELVLPLKDEGIPIRYKNYTNMVDALIDESELTIGFVLREDIEQYTARMKEVQNTANYIQETTLELQDESLMEYQTLYRDMERRNKSFKYFTISLLITSIMLGGYIAARFSRSIHKPVRKLSDAAKEVSYGKFDGEPVHVYSSDELKLLGDSFNTMRSNIQGLIKEIKNQSEQDMLMKELELKHLQNQIHPHFLFNTLNTVSKMAYFEDAPATSKLIESLATMMRHSLGDLNHMVDLQEEIKMVRNYVHIQSVRFMERVEFYMDPLAEDVHVPIPRLTIQPLVENAFIHGIESLEEGGKIEVLLREELADIIIEVRDNGVGISDEQQKRLFQGDNQEHVGHVTGIGLSNVYKRLQLFYQRDDVLEIDSTIGEGTTIRLKIPKQVGGDAE